MKFNRDILYITTIIVLLGLVGQFWYSYEYKPKAERKIDVYYNQEVQLNQELIKLIRDADQYVHFAIYTFTRKDIQDALLSAKYRGVEVVGLIDREQSLKIEEQGKIVEELKKAGITVYEQNHSSIMHLKVLVTEKAYASGSFNWTSAATNLNDEVLEVGRDPDMRDKYKQVLQKMFNFYKPQN